MTKRKKAPLPRLRRVKGEWRVFWLGDLPINCPESCYTALEWCKRRNTDAPN